MIVCKARTKGSVWALSVPVMIILLAVSELPSVYGGHQFATPEPMLGEQRTVVILVEFPDAKHASERSKEVIRSLIFSYGSKYLLEDSYGLTGPFVPAGIAEGVTDWIMLPERFGNYVPPAASANRLIIEAIKAADKSVDFGDVRRIFIVVAWSASLRAAGFNRRIPAGVPTSEGMVNTAVQVVRELSPLLIFLDEFGHALGLPHWYQFRDPRNLTSYDFSLVGLWDPMSISHESMYFRAYDTQVVHHSAWSKTKLGWIPDERVKVVMPGQTVRVWIDPIELPSKGVQAVKVVVDDRFQYLVEVRQKIGFDSILPKKGVLITSYNASLLECWNVPPPIGEIITENCGPLRVIDAHSSEETYKRPGALDDAPYDIGPLEKQVFWDSSHNITITVLEKRDLSYLVQVASGTSPVTVLERVVTIEVEKEVVKEVPKEVIREVPKEVIREVVKEVPKEVTRTVTVETISPISYGAIAIGVILIIVAGMLFTRKRPG